jgi:hypothetical protein
MLVVRHFICTQELELSSVSELSVNLTPLTMKQKN